MAAGGGLIGIARPAVGLTINPRSDWATNRPTQGPLPSEDVRFLLVHHSASRNGHTTADAPGILRGFYDFHTGPEKGWNDIAYNFLIDSGGGIWEGRAGSIAGAVAGDATGGNQGFSQLVCVIGDYNAATPSAAAKRSLAGLLAWIADKHGVATTPGSEVSFVSRGSNRWPSGTSVTTPTITGHRTMSKTTCPGDNLYSYVTGSLTADVTAIRGGTPAPATSPASSTSSTTSSSTTSSTTPPTTATSVTTTTAPFTSTSANPVPTAPQSQELIRPTITPPPVSAITIPTTSTTVPPIAADQPLPPIRSPLLWSAAGLASVTTALLAWRYRRMNR